MKRFISALSSLCLAATAVFSAFPGMQAAAADDTASAKSASLAAAEGTVVYNMIPVGIDNYTKADQTKDGTFNVVSVEPGAKVTMALTVANDPGTAGMQFYFKVDDGITVGRRTTGNAYEVTVKWNSADYAYVWSTDDGTAAKAADNSTLSTFALTMPETDGNYSITLDSSKENMVRPQGRVGEAENIPYEFHGITFSVGNAPEVTTTEPKQATDPSPTDVVSYNFVPQGLSYTKADQSKDGTLNVVDVTPGQKLTVDLTVSNDPGTSGMQLYFKVDDGITVGRRTTGSAYEVTVKWNATDYAYVWSTDDGTAAKAADGAVMSSFAITAPSAKGQYSIALDNSRENMVRPQGRVGEAENIPFYFHGITLNVTETSETTTTEKQQIPEGDEVIYNLVPQGLSYEKAAQATDGALNKVEVTPGQRFTMDFTVEKDPGTSGMQLYFKVDDGITVGRRTTGSAYEVTVKWNATDYAYVWSTDDGTATKAADGAVLSSFAITAPSTKGDYVIQLDESKENMVRPQGTMTEAANIPFIFHGLQITVVDEVTTTETTEYVPSGDEVIYNLIPQGLDYTKAKQDEKDALNVVEVTPGQRFTMDFTVEKDPGTSGMQLYFKVDDGITVGRRTTGSAYEVTVKWNATDYAYVWSTDDGTATKAADGAVLSSFAITAPSAKGDYVIQLDESKENMVRPQGTMTEAANIPYIFHGLQISVVDVLTTTTTIETTTTTTKTTTSEPGETTTQENIPAGKSNWVIGEKHAAAGETGVKVPVTVTGDEGTSGFHIFFTYDKDLTFKGFEWTEGYTGEATLNADKQIAVWADADGADQKIPDGTVIMYLIFDAPDAAGTYPVEFVDKDNLEVINTSGNKLTVEATNGAVIVDETTTSSATTTTSTETTTTEEDIAAGKSNWVIAEKHASAGETDVKVPVTVSGDEGTAGFHVFFTYDEALTFKGFEWTEGYTGEATLNNDKLIVVWASEDGEDQKVTDDTVILNLIFDAPDAAGTYPVEFVDKDNLEVVNTSGNKLTVDATNGAVIIDETTTSSDSTTTETTTTESDVPAGKTQWVIAEKHASAGETDVKVPVTVSGDEGTAGFHIFFTYDEALTFKGFEWTEGYTGEATLNNDKLIVVWASEDGEDQKVADDTVILNLIFDAPDAAGTYPVEFVDKDNLEVINTSGNVLTVDATNGAVIVDETTTSSDTTTTESTTTDTTTTESTTTDTTTTESTTTESTTTDSTTTESTTTDSTTTESTTTDSTTTVSTTTDSTTTVSTTTDSTTTESTTTDSTTTVSTTTDSTTTVSTTTDSTTTVSTTTDSTTTETTTTVSTTTVTTTTETTTTTTTTTLAPGTVGWYIGTKTASAGETGVKVPVTVKGDTGTSGFIVKFAYDSALTFTGFEWGDAYTGEATLNNDKLIVVWADNDGADQTAAEDATVLYLTFTAPDEAGTYPVTFDVFRDSTSLEVVDTNGRALELFQKDGAVIVEETTTSSETTTTDSTTTVSTTTDSTTTVSTTTDSTTTVSTTTESTTTDSTTTVSTTTESTTTDSTTTVSTTTDSTTTVSTTTESTTTDSTTTVSTTTVSTTTVSTTTESTTTDSTTTVSTTTESTTTVSTTTDSTTTVSTTTDSTTTVSTTSTSTETSTTVTTVSTDSTTTTTDTTTTPSPIEVNPGHVVYQIDDVNGLAGTTVKVPVFVWWDEGTAGFEMQFSVPDGFKISGYEWGDAYPEGKIAWNPDTYNINWDNGDGEEITAKPGAKILTLLVDVPTDAAEETTFPIQFVDGSVHVTDTDSNELEYSTVDGSIYILKIPFDDPGSVVYNVGDAEGEQGGKAEIPLTVWFDDGTAEFEMDLVLPDGVTIDDISFGEGYAENGTFSYDPETKKLKWTSNDGKNYIPEPGEPIATITVSIGEDVEPGTYTVSLDNIKPLDENGQELKYKVNDGELTIKEKVRYATTYEIKYEEPGRIYYWSHDKRTFAEANGLEGMKATLVISKYYVNADGAYTDADGNVVDAPVIFETEEIDITDYVHTDAAENSPANVWDNETAAEIAAGRATEAINANHANVYSLAFNFYAEEMGNADVLALVGSEPVHAFDHTIYIGVKGDTNLDNHVDTDDAIMSLKFYTLVVVVGFGREDSVLNQNVPTKEMDDFCFFLTDVNLGPIGNFANPEMIDTDDTIAQLKHYTLNVVVGLPTNWDEDGIGIGYDFVDKFHEGFAYVYE